MTEHVDVLIVGAGISGISAAYHLQRDCPGRSYAILEGRAAIGGTWDLFRYPGIRSDSDMHTLGYSFRPWTEAKSIADGPSIRSYVVDTAAQHGIDRHIRFGHRAISAEWSTADARWTLIAEHDGAAVVLTCGFLFMCSGYYDYAAGYTPDFPGREAFAGRFVHPQHWPADLDYAGKRVVVIGSGATAVTLVPELAKQAAHVTMLQRSPTYVVARPDEDATANRLRRWLPAGTAYALTRWKNVLWQMYFYRICKTQPAKAKTMLLDEAAKALGPDYDIATHFTPRYNPWEQRLCLVPNGDLFAALKDGSASVVTDHIAALTADGIALQSGTTLPADIIVSATGLNLKVLGGLQIGVDGVAVDPARQLIYKGMMYQDVPNLAFAFGYTNASWTLKADLTSEYVCRLLNSMDKAGAQQMTPRLNDPSVTPEAFVDFSSGYFQRSMDSLPKQGSKAPWKLHQNYARDLMSLRFGKVADGTMTFTKVAPKAATPAALADA